MITIYTRRYRAHLRLLNAICRKARDMGAQIIEARLLPSDPIATLRIDVNLPILVGSKYVRVYQNVGWISREAA